MLSPKRILKRIESFAVFDSYHKRYRLYTHLPHLINLEAGNISYFKTNKGFETEDEESIPTFLQYQKIPKEKFKNQQLFAIFITKRLRRPIYKFMQGKDEELHLQGVLMYRYYKWINFSLPIGFIVAQHTPKLNLINTPFRFIECERHVTYKDLGYYQAKYQECSDEELIKFYNEELYRTNDKFKEVRLIAFYMVFKQRFDKNPITLNKQGKMIWRNKIVYSNTLNTIINIGEN